MLKAVDLTLWRGPRCLFGRLSFEVAEGAAVLVRGANGSGKTTLLRVLCGLTRPESGHVEWNHAPVEKNRGDFGAQLAYIGHQTGLKADLSVSQNLAFFARLNGQHGQPWRAFLEALNLSGCADLEVRYLSAGQKRRVALARMLMSDARLWVMDEPFSNLDASGRNFLTGQIAALLERGGTGVVATHGNLDIDAQSTHTIHLGDRP